MKKLIKIIMKWRCKWTLVHTKLNLVLICFVCTPSLLINLLLLLLLKKNYRAATIFVRLREFSWKYAFRPDEPLDWNFELGPTTPILGRSAQIFFVGHIYITTFGGNHFWGPSGPNGRELKGGGGIRPP